MFSNFDVKFGLILKQIEGGEGHDFGQSELTELDIDSELIFSSFLRFARDATSITNLNKINWIAG